MSSIGIDNRAAVVGIGFGEIKRSHVDVEGAEQGVDDRMVNAKGGGLHH